MEQTDPRHLLVSVTRILDLLNIPYFITGGIAVLIWGRPRFTADIDVVVALKSIDGKKLSIALRKLGKAGYISESAIEEALVAKGEFNFIDGNTGMKVDFWISKDDELSTLKFQRRKARKISGKNVYFISPEDLILSKLEWHRLSESTRQLEDIESILKISGSVLDMKYLIEWSKKLGVGANLEKLLSKREEV